MAQVFTDFVRSLDPAGEPPEPEAFDRVLRALRRELERELRRRGLTQSSPRYLGVYGRERWWGPEGALEDLVADAYAYVFVQRLRHLLAQLEIKPHIEGLVRLNVRNFFHERQKKHDPLGYRVFEILHAAVTAAVEGGQLRILEGGPAIRNETLLRVTAAARPASRGSSMPPAAAPGRRERLEQIVRGWNDTLLPGLFHARGADREALIGELRRRLADLPTAGVEGDFTFREVIEPLKNDARVRWPLWHGLTGDATAFEEGEHDAPEPVPLVHPDTGFEERQHFDQLTGCLDEALERVEETPAGKEHLQTLWEFLRTWAAEPRGELPSRRRLAARLGIPRNRMAGLFATLQRLVEDCREAISAPAVVIAGSSFEGSAGAFAGDTAAPSAPSALGKAAGSEDAMVERTSRLEALRRATGEARAAAETALDRDRGGGPRPGDLVVLPATAGLPLEWALLEAPEAGPGVPQGFLAVPADAHPLAGRADVAVAAGEPGGPLTLRCGFAVRLAAPALEAARRTGSLAPETVERARRRCRDVAEAKTTQGETPSIRRRGADDDPEYRSWVLEVLEPARAAVTEPVVVPLHRRRWSPSLQPWPLAASVLLLVCLGLGGGWWWERRENVRLRTAGSEEPLIDLPFAAISPAGPARSAPEVLTVPDDAGYFLFLLNIVELEHQRKYRLTVSRLGPMGAKERLWEGDLAPTGATTLSVAFPAPWLTPGEFVLELYGTEENKNEPLGRYVIQVERNETGP